MAAKKNAVMSLAEQTIKSMSPTLINGIQKAQATPDKVAPVQQTFTPSETTNTYQAQLKQLEGNAPGAYTSKYQSQIDALMDKITNREKFSYDFNADPLYQQYKDSYTKLGKEASMNAVANAANLTGGYGNSYAATAGAQANQQYLTQLNDVIPELYNAAMDKYQMEGQDLLDQYGIYSDAEQAAYSQYRDKVSDYYNNLSYYQNAYNNALGNDMNLANFNESVRQYNQNMAYQQARDQVADQQWKAQFDESVRQFGMDYALQQAAQELAQKEYQTSTAQWQQSFDYNKERDAVSDSQWQQSFNYNKERDAVSDAQWQKQFEYNKEQDAIANALNSAKIYGSDTEELSDITNDIERLKDNGLGQIVNFALSQAQWGKMGGNNDPVYDYLYTQYESGKISDSELESIYNYVKMQKG